MPVPTIITDLSATASSNSPTGSESIGSSLDDYIRAAYAILRASTATKGADIASASTTDLGAVAGLFHDITGNTTITGFGTVGAGIWKLLKFEGALTLTHNATSLIIPGGQNITTADGDMCLVSSEGSGNWRVYAYIKANANTVLGTRSSTIWIPAAAMTPRTTNGADVSLTESSTNKVMMGTVDFDASTNEYAQFAIRMPNSWNEGSISAQVDWRAATATGDCAWVLEALSLSDDDAIDAAFGTGVTVVDSVTATNDLMKSATIAAVVAAGTPAAGDLVQFQLSRFASAAADTLATDARCVGVTIFYNIDTNTDA